jgi:hypothetical protein
MFFATSIRLDFDQMARLDAALLTLIKSQLNHQLQKTQLVFNVDSDPTLNHV